MTRNIVTEQDNVDPNELQRTRRNPSLNTPGLEQQTELPPPAPAPLDVEGNEAEQPLPQPEPDDVLSDYSLKGYFVPPRNEDPVPLPVLESDDERLQDLQQQAQQQQLGDSFILSQQLRSRVVDAYNTSTRNRYVPTVTNGFDPIDVNNTARYLDERRQAVLQQTRPLGTNPEEGILGVGRNILSGRPFTRATEQVLNDQFTRMGEDGRYQSRIERFYRWLPQPLRALVASRLASAVRAENLAQLIYDVRQAERKLIEEDPEYRTLGRRVLDELRKYGNPFDLNSYITPREYNMFRSVTEQPGPLLQELSESSPVFRQMMNDLGPTLDEAGNAVFNPLQGQWGEFGSAGSLSAALYLLNIPEGVLVGTLYDVADEVRSIAGNVNPNWRPPERNLRRIDTLSPFVGRDTGFTQRYSEDKYLSAAGNPALRWLDPRLQLVAGFLGDLVAGGAADAVFDGLIGPGRRAVLRSARGVLDESTDPTSSAVREASNAIAQFEGVGVARSELRSRGLVVTETAAKSPASEATLPLVSAPAAVVEETPVRRYNPFRAARQGGSINTVEEYVEQIAAVLNRIDETPAIIRQAEVADMVTVRRSMAEAQANYEATLESMVRQVDSAARSMTQQNFRSLVESFMRQVAKNGTEVATDGAIVLRQPDSYVDALSTAVRSELVTPWYRQFPEVLDTYREAPLALPPQAFDLTRRPTDDVVELAKMWEVLPPSATSNDLRITQLSRSNPEFGRVWGTQIDEGVSAAIRRVVVQPEDGLNNLAERSRVVGSLPSSRVEVVSETPFDVESRLTGIRRKYAEEAVRVVNLSPARQRSAFNRMQQLQQEGAELIADYPEVAARIVARDYTPDPKYETPRNLALGQAILNVEHQQATYNQLMDELNVVNRRVEQQQQLLRQLPPLERRSVHNEINTRLSAGENPVVRSVNNSTSISTDTIYQAARLEVWNDPRLRTADVTVTQLLEDGELSSLPEREAMAVLQNMRDNCSIRFFEDGPRGLEETSLIVDPNFTYVGLAIGSEIDEDRFVVALANSNDISELTKRADGIQFLQDGSVLLDGRVSIPLEKRLEVVEADSLGKPVNLDLANEANPIQVDYSETVIGSGSYGNTVLRSDGTFVKRGRVTDDEVRLQPKAALQGLAPEVLSEVEELGPDTKEFAMQFLSDFKPLSEFADYDANGNLIINGFDEAQQSVIRSQVFELLDKLHLNGIVHNDFHEANIMVNPDTLELKAIDFGLATDLSPERLADSLTDYGFVSDFLFQKPTFYHGTRYSQRANDADVWSLSNEFGPAVYLTDDLAKAERYAKAIPSQDVVTSSTNRIPRREPIGNVQAVVLDIPQESIQPVENYRDNIFRAFDTVLNTNGETRLRRNFKAWVKRNEDPIHWWHYLRERFTDERLADLAKLQLKIRDNLISQGVRAFYSPATKDVVVIDPSAVLHRSVPHTVEAQGSIIEGLVNRNAVDSDLLAALDNKTTRAIDAHNKLNIDTYVENQLKAAVGEQEIEVLNSIRELNQQRQLQQADWLNNRQTTRRNIIDELEREAGSNIRKFLRSQDDFCL